MFDSFADSVCLDNLHPTNTYMRHSPVANQAIDLCSVPLMHAARERSRRKNGHKNAVAVLANKVYIYMKLKVELRKKKTEYGI